MHTAMQAKKLIKNSLSRDSLTPVVTRHSSKLLKVDKMAKATEYELGQIKEGFAITLPPSYQVNTANRFANKFWQGKPSPPR